MKKDQFIAMLQTDYRFTLKGSTITYLLNLLADEQKRLDHIHQKNITDPTAAAAAVANQIVGSDIFEAIYKMMGGEFLGEAFGLNPDRIMEIMKPDTRPKDAPLN